MTDKTANSIPSACLQPQRSILRLSGTDRRAFLQGLISNDVQLCQPGQPLYAALLTPQGKFLHDLFLIDQGENFLVDCEAARAEDLLKRLNAHKLRSKVSFENVSDLYDVWAIWGAGLPDLVDFYPDPRLTELGLRGILAKDQRPHDVQFVDSDAYDLHRLNLNVPDGSRDMVIEKSTLLECNMDRLNAISWTKGCYMGQELTARTHYRGLVKKRLFPVRIEGEVPATGAILYHENEDCGEMRSTCQDRGLALLNLEKAQKAIETNGFLTSGTTRLFVLQ